MKPYKLVTGSLENIEKFEAEISSLLEQGYDLNDDLKTQVIQSPNGKPEVLLLQSLMFEELLEMDMDEDDDDEDYDDILIETD